MTDSVIKILNMQRKQYASEQKFHYFSFAAFSLILLLDIVIIIYSRAITFDAYSWSGIILLLVLMFVEGIQCNKFSNKIEDLDKFYLGGEYETRKK